MSELNKVLIEWFGEMISKWAGAVGTAFIIGSMGWAANVSFQLWTLSAQGQSLEKILTKIEEFNLVEKRVSYIEATRFSETRGTTLETKVSTIEEKIDSMKKDIQRFEKELAELKKQK